MFRSILLPLDGSKFAEEAIPLALSIAHRAGASLELLHVHELYAMHDTHGPWLPYSPAEDAQFRANEQAYLDATVKGVRVTASIPVTSALVDGLTEDAIVKRARTRHPDLIVLPTHGRSPLSRLCFGGVAEGLIRCGLAPILLVRCGKPPDGPRPKAADKRMLILLDGSESAEKVLKPAVALGALANTEYTLVRTVEPSLFTDGFATVVDVGAIDHGCQERRAMAQAYLDRVAERLREKGLRVQTRVAVGKSPCVAILDDVRAHHVDLIAVAAHRRSVLQRLFWRSVADGVAWRSTVPVLVCCPA